LFKLNPALEREEIANAMALSFMAREVSHGLRCLKPSMSSRRLEVLLNAPIALLKKIHFPELERNAYAKNDIYS
jgi:hypothetical protein